MSRINELIEQLCPAGVEFKEIGTVISALRTGLNPRQNFKLNSIDAEYHYITVRELNGFSIKATEKTDRVDSIGLKLIQNRSKIQTGDILFSGTGTIGRTAHVTDCPSNWNVKEGIYVLTPIVSLIDARFLIYLIQSSQIHNQILSKADGSTVASISMASLQKIKIPVPPIEIQQEIVKTLDLFTGLEAELEAELEARKTQYIYYRDALLNFEGKDVEWKTLGEVCTLITKGTTPKSYKQSGVSFIKTEAFVGSRIERNKLSYIDEVTHQTILKRSILKANDILVTIAGATIGKAVIVTNDILPANTNQALAIIRLNKDVNTKYIFYILKSEYMRQYINQSVKGSAQPNLNLKQLNDFNIPIPPPSEQERIVNILDKFDSMVNDISIGLPAEIEARRKQYEYYRNRLLTFKNFNNG
jgi:type I restriction enzyme, S subunit